MGITAVQPTPPEAVLRQAASPQLDPPYYGSPGRGHNSSSAGSASSPVFPLHENSFSRPGAASGRLDCSLSFVSSSGSHAPTPPRAYLDCVHPSREGQGLTPHLPTSPPPLEAVSANTQPIRTDTSRQEAKDHPRRQASTGPVCPAGRRRPATSSRAPGHMAGHSCAQAPVVLLSA